MGTLDTAEKNTTPAPIALFGADEAGKFHASRFLGQEADRVTKAAQLMGFHVLALSSPECGDLAERLPTGRLFGASGKAFCPFVAKPTYERLATLGGVAIEPAAPKAAKPAKAAVEQAEGSEGAETKERKSKKAAPTPKPEIAPYVEPTNVPQDWPHIRQGSLVLASNGSDDEAWWKCIIVEVKDDALCVCIWAGWETPLFLRRRNQLALLPEGTPLKGDA